MGIQKIKYKTEKKNSLDRLYNRVEAIKVRISELKDRST